MDLWDVMRKSGGSSAAVFGMAKNAGKTVALNNLASAAGREELLLGMTSIGRDGEAWDALTHRRKPSIRVEQGTLIATAEACLRTGTADLQIVEKTNIATPLGPVHVARVRRSGRVELAGPSRLRRLAGVVNRLIGLGADFVLVDGAIDRRGLASPRVTDACVLATGAILSEVPEEAVRLTRERVRQLTLPRAPEELRRVWHSGRVVVRAGGGTETFTAAEALKGGGGIRSRIRECGTDVLVGGALADSLLLELMGKRVRIVVRDSTCLFLDDRLLERFERAGGRVEVVEPIRLVAVTVNPHSPEGWSFDAGAFFQAVRKALPGMPVFDVTAGLGPE